MEPSTLIRQARKAAGLTQAELAKRAGMNQPEIARLESAGANPRLSTLKRVVAATGHALRLDLDEEFGLDETLIAASLRESPAERLRGFESLYDFARAFGGKAFRPGGS
ncbi:MAG TPA: helix-turn-helix domain-containing protein [Solirubrobacterales bacterium]|nr:helix-turn-helix domain-containing protein [Solirubrobacterales bacterium]